MSPWTPDTRRLEHIYELTCRSLYVKLDTHEQVTHHGSERCQERTGISQRNERCGAAGMHAHTQPALPIVPSSPLLALPPSSPHYSQRTNGAKDRKNLYRAGNFACLAAGLPAFPYACFHPEVQRHGNGDGEGKRWVPTLRIFVNTSLPPATVAAAACLLIDPAVVLSCQASPSAGRGRCPEYLQPI